ncbi:MAG: hypothetical protein EON88_24960 [Brevundimonas sp.]|nr:MAG: hypothetical protein EON88_24960 [Brevundimonas sp.]
MGPEDIVLHIGRHKSGTTSIQQALAANADGLDAQGWRYVAAGRARDAHHPVAALFLPERKRTFAAGYDLAHVRNAVEQELGAMRDRRAILSSEMFQSVSAPGSVASLIPPERSHLIVYLREQYAYVQSAYAESVKIGQVATPFEDYLDLFTPKYERFLAGWKTDFGAARTTVAIYDRAALIRGDAVDDFCARVGIDNAGFTRVADANDSLGGALLEFRRRLNALSGLPRPLRRRMIPSLIAIARGHRSFKGRPWAPPGAVARFRQRFVEPNRALVASGLTGGVGFGAPPSVEPEPVALDEAAVFAEIWRLLDAREPNLWRSVADVVRAAAVDHAEIRALADALPT